MEQISSDHDTGALKMYRLTIWIMKAPNMRANDAAAISSAPRLSLAPRFVITVMSLSAKLAACLRRRPL
jgi:hypothetical protein